MRISKYVICSGILIILLASNSYARYRVDTYIDDHGVRRVQKTGKIYRDYKAVKEFKKSHPKPQDGHAYDVDHIKPLIQGGADTPSNMQWIRTEDHRRKKYHGNP